MSFTKLFASLLDSTLWVEQPHHVVRVWVTMLAMADKDGLVAASVPGLARRACVTTAEAEEALRVFLSPDRYSRTPDHEGRRIREVAGGWELLNYAKYRAKMVEDVRRDRARDSMRDLRARRSVESDSVPPFDSQNVTAINPYASASSGSEDPNPDPDPGAEPVPATEPAPPPEHESEPDPEPPVIRVDRAKGRFVPEAWKPKAQHLVRCQELRFDPAELERGFRLQEFNREYSDWDRRFSKWIEDQKLKRDAERFKASQRIPGIRASPAPEPWLPDARAEKYRERHHISPKDWNRLLAEQFADEGNAERSLREQHRVFGERLANFCRRRDGQERRPA